MVIRKRSRYLGALAAVVLAAALGLSVEPALAAAGTSVYVSPSGSDANNGPSTGQPVQTLQRAREIVRGLDGNMSGDITVQLADGYYRLTRPLTLTSADSGTNGHTVVWAAASGARPVVVGSTRLTGWTQVAGTGVCVAQAPKGLRTRQLYVEGARAQRATGRLPVTLTKTSTGYTASAATMAGWRDPSGQATGLCCLILLMRRG
jgi:hypothetical protein